MKILLLDLSDGSEDFSGNRYGGIGRTFYQIWRDNPNTYIAGHPNSFSRAIHERFYFIENSAAIIDFDCPWLKEFDLVIHTRTNVFLKTDVPQLVWCPGQGETVHKDHRFVLLHNPEGQKPNIQGSPKIFKFVLGIDVPEFQEHEKEDCIVQISNHYPQIQTHIIIDFCNRNKIKGYFGGPMAEGYDIKSLCNGFETRYLGVVTEDVKINLLKKAKLFSCLLGFPINETMLSVKQALSYGCGIIATPIGHMTKSIYPGVNGFFVTCEADIENAWNNRNTIKQKNCYDSIQKYSAAAMKESLDKVFKEICPN